VGTASVIEPMLHGGEEVAGDVQCEVVVVTEVDAPVTNVVVVVRLSLHSWHCLQLPVGIDRLEARAVASWWCVPRA